MNSPIIKTYKSSAAVESRHFFILSKGFNAGKPLDKPCPNCFMVTASTMEEKGKLYWICYCLWKSATYIPLLHGSVIPFLRVKDVAAEIEKAILYVNAHEKEFDHAVVRLQHLFKTEKLLSVQLKLINGIKHSITRRLIAPLK